MYAVIFRAEIANFDEDYHHQAARMRELALGQYGCLEFIAVSEGNQEIAISYWPDKEKIRAWRNAPEHLEVQEKGRIKWYKSYRVEVVKVERGYDFSIKD